MKLYLLQHAESCSKDVDPKRPLTGRGLADAQRLAAFLKGAGVRVGRVIHSEKLRAVQTAEIMAGSIAPGVTPESSGIIDPNDSPKAFDWQSNGWDRDTLVVGHLPFLAKLVSHLVIGDEERTLAHFQPGTLVCLERDEEGRWRIGWMLRPALLA